MSYGVEGTHRASVVWIALAVLASMLGALLLLGRSWWGAAHGPGLWTGNIHGAFNSQLLADPFTVAHVNHGLALFLLVTIVARQIPADVGILMTVVLEAVWEVAENTAFAIEHFRQEGLAQGYYGDSILNSLGDVASAATGFGLAVLVARTRSPLWVLGGFVALEVLLIAWIGEGVIQLALSLVRIALAL